MRLPRGHNRLPLECYRSALPASSPAASLKGVRGTPYTSISAGLRNAGRFTSVSERPSRAIKP